MSVVLTVPAGIRAVLNKMTIDASKTITGATNASPAVITSVAHGYNTGDVLGISAVGGNTNCNIVGVAQVIDADTYSLLDKDGVAVNGNSNYTSGGKSQRMRPALTPGDIGDIQDTLNRRNYPKPSDKDRANQTTLVSIFGL